MAPVQLGGGAVPFSQQAGEVAPDGSALRRVEARVMKCGPPGHPTQ